MEHIVQSALAAQARQEGPVMEVKQACIKVIGCGGAGTNMVNWLYQKGVTGAEIIATNTDLQHLNTIQSDRKLLIGKNVTKGLGCGGFPQKGAESAQESIQELKEMVKGTDLIFVCAGMGGGTGTGSAPVIAKISKDAGAIVIGTVTMPFKIERARVEKAEFGLMCLRKGCDTVIVIDNNRLVRLAGNLPIAQAFAVANELISTMIKGIVETISIPSLVNLDYADVKSIMTDGGVAVIGVGSSDTNNRVDEAVKGALANPLLDISYKGASGALIHICGGPDMTLEEINRAGELITDSLDDDANVIWGARVEDEMKGKMTVMSIITGVKSPWILGNDKPAEEMVEEIKVSRRQRVTPELEELPDELGIEIIK